MQDTFKIKNFINENISDLYVLLEDLCKIPAPSHFEDERAQFCFDFLRSVGAEDLYIDSAKNVVLEVNCKGSDAITVFCAHTDTVFPDREPMKYTDDTEIIRCPGAGDDSASLAVLLFCAKYILENSVKPERGILLVANSCEEGLGNLKGTKEIFRAYEGRIKEFVSFDASIGTVNDRCVGSHRYEVTVTTEGGHSFGAFGNKNAIEVLSRIVCDIYNIKTPEKEGCKTTYNVGSI